MIRAVTIDLWNTLVDSSNGASRRAYRIAAVGAALERAGVPRDAEEIDAALQALYPLFDRHWKGEHRTLTSDEMVAAIWKQMGIEMPADLHRNVVGNFEESILHGPPRLLDGAADGVARLASFAALALISDTAFSPGRILARLLEEWGIRRHFRLLVFSDETGVSKPHRLAFDTALKGLDASPREAVHVGDIEWTDIRGAKDFGMRAILFRGDARSPFRSEGTPTAADAVAENWDETLRIIDAWRKGAPRAGEQVP